MMADCSPCVDNARRTDAEPGYRRFPLPDVVAFTGGGKLVRKATGYEQQKAEAALSRIGFTGCASRASGRHWSVSVDPQISPTRQKLKDCCLPLSHALIRPLNLCRR